ncbi:ABC transporter ATP-binding protein, partial [Escherichia coli]|nr:ABC transporter ATP-binding protein [Escherichia coli]
ANNLAKDLLKKVGIARQDEILNSYPHQLSGGMRQRVMIAMAISCSPKLLIADEPTTALDVTIQAQILDLLKELQKETQMAIMMITHEMRVIKDICNRVAVMEKGQVVET